jgi:hypothetical protein
MMCVKENGTIENVLMDGEIRMFIFDNGIFNR